MKHEHDIDKEALSITPTVEREWIKQDKIVYGALVGAGLFLVQPFLYEGYSKDLAGKIAVIAFSLAIPMLAALLLLNEEETFRRHPSKSRIVAVVRVLGQATAFTGFIAAFWHADTVAGICALVASIIGMSAHSAGYTKLYYSRYRPKK